VLAAARYGGLANHDAAIAVGSKGRRIAARSGQRAEISHHPVGADPEGVYRAGQIGTNIARAIVADAIGERHGSRPAQRAEVGGHAGGKRIPERVVGTVRAGLTGAD